MPDRTSKLRRTTILGAALAAALAANVGPTPGFAQTVAPSDRVGGVVSITGSGAAVRAFGARVSVDGTNARVKVAGAVVDVRGEVEGSLWVAGADVTVDASVGAALRAAGARVGIRGRTSSDLMVAGALVDVDAVVAGNVRVAGANVRLGALTNVGGTLSAAGASIVFDGQVAGGANFTGAAVTVNGNAGGDVSVQAERLIIGPQAVIAGNIVVHSLSEPEVAPGAMISGEIVVERPGEWFDSLPGPTAPIVASVFALSIVLVGLVFLIFARNTYGEAVDHVRFRPLSTVAYGIAYLLVLTLLAGVLMATAVGFALGLALILLLPMVLVLSQPVAAGGIVGWIFSRTVPRLEVPRLILFLILGALVIAFAGIIPFTGPWIVVVILAFGVGAVFRAVLWRFRSARTSDATFGSAKRGEEFEHQQREGVRLPES